MPFIIRKAKIGDLLKTYEWANEKDVIRNSINRKKKFLLKSILYGLTITLTLNLTIFLLVL